MAHADQPAVRMTNAGSVPADLSLCAREPIHIPGAIQPHGAVLIALADASRITHASANLYEFLSLHAADALGKPLDFALGESAGRDLKSRAPSLDAVVQHCFSLLGREGTRLQLRAFRSGLHLVIDIERVSVDTDHNLELTIAHGLLNSFHRARSVVELCNLAVTGLRSITGYDRVMAYRFGPDGHGEVIAEARADGMEAYLGQWYPASDIPEQARRLYLRQRVGVIVDAGYEPVALLVESAAHEDGPVDLTHSALRSVSPIHREFMRNMNTAASMTIGLERNDDPLKPELWGMIVCHHRTPRLAGIETRSLANLVGQMLALLIAGQMNQERYARQIGRQTTLARILARLDSPESILASMAAEESALLHLVDATGVVIRLQGERICLGATPDGHVLDALFAIMCREANGQALAVDHLSARDPLFAASATACSGALMLPLSDDPANAIVWIRPERAQTLTWGGNPTKPTTADAVTGRISPRASFEAWKEVVFGRSLPWSLADVALAKELKSGIESQLARRTKLVLDLLGRIFGSSPVALLLIDRPGNIKMVNGEAERIFGYERDELVGCPLEQLVPARLRPQHARQRDEYLVKPSLRKMGESAELYGLRKDGSEFPIEVILNVVPSEDALGEPLIQACLTDLTARRAGEQATRAAQDRLHSIATHVPALISYWSRDLRCEFANEAYRDWFGVPPERIVGMSMRELLGEDQFLKTEVSVRSVLAGEAQHFETVLRKPDGSVGYTDARYIPDTDDKGAVHGFYVLVTDVSSLQEARVALEQSNAELTHTNLELDQFVYTASHDLRSPLRAIGSLAQFVLEDDATLQTETKDRLNLIISRSRRMQKMLDQILEYARAGKDGGEGVPVEVSALIDEIVATLGVPPQFRIVKDASLASILVHPMPLSQVLQNLIGNSIKHHDAARGTVTISAQRAGLDWRFSVVDDGPGVPLQYRESVFDMFTTLKRRDEVEASGMGLALVAKLVKMQGGRCGIEPASGRGMRFWFDWPLCH